MTQRGKLIPPEFPCPTHGSPARITAYSDGEYEVSCHWGSHELSAAQMASASESWPDPPPDPLTALRAEVEALRDGCLRQWRSVDYALPEAQPEARAWIAGYEAASIEVLDLIDKHTREGQ